jgi:hypothetical protein
VYTTAKDVAASLHTQAEGKNVAKLLIALWSYPSSAHYGSKWGDLIAPFRAKVEATSKEAAKYNSLEKKNAFQAIFAAPEYIFVGKDAGKHRIPMTEGDRDNLVRDLAAISHEFRNILIFAGSIFYKQSMASTPNVQRANANMIAATLDKQNNGFGRLVTHGANAGGVGIPSLNDGAKKMKATTYRAFNSMYAFLGGDRVMTPYNKEFDCKETEGADTADIVYIPGSSPGTRTVGDFEFAVEVCVDHHIGARKEKGDTGYFHVVVSDWVDTKTANMVQVDGYFLHASSNHRETGVYNAAKTKVSPLGSAPKSNGLSFWLVDVAKKEVNVPELVVPVQNPLKQGALMAELTKKLNTK